MGKTNFGLNVVAAILKFKMAAYINMPNVTMYLWVTLDIVGRLYFSHSMWPDRVAGAIS